MLSRLTDLEIRNFRSLANVRIELDPLNVLFGPNGAGKSTFLDTIWFLADCALRGVDFASSARSHGIGMLWDGADEGTNIHIKVGTESAEYEITVGFSSGRIESFVGESLWSRERRIRLIDRKIASDRANFYRDDPAKPATATLRQPEKLALTRYLDFPDSLPCASDLDRLLRDTHIYLSRSADLDQLKKHGSESSHHTWLYGRCGNLWSLLRNLHDRTGVDRRYDTIMRLMRESFPEFKGLLIEQTGPNSVYASFLERGRRHPIRASGVSDGHLQMLIHLAALFSEENERYSLILFDEPEASLHPYALAVLAKAVKLATQEWNKQVLIATHSPVLLSQFDAQRILAVEIGASGETIIKRVSQMKEIADLLEQYAVGSLYMAEAIAPQSKPFAELAQ